MLFEWFVRRSIGFLERAQRHAFKDQRAALDVIIVMLEEVIHATASA